MKSPWSWSHDSVGMRRSPNMEVYEEEQRAAGRDDEDDEDWRHFAFSFHEDAARYGAEALNEAAGFWRYRYRQDGARWVIERREA